MESQRNAPRWLKLLVGFHVLAITSWSLPKSSPGVLNNMLEPRGLDWVLYANDRYVRVSPVQQYILSLGLFQSWDMFAPNPTNKDIWCDAIVRYRDGSEKVYTYPRVSEVNYAEKYVIERYRKFYERVNHDLFQWMWPDFAQRVAVKMDDPANPPVQVVLRRNFIVTPRTITFPDYCSNVMAAIREGRLDGETLSPANPVIPPFEQSVFLIYDVDQERLALARTR